VITVYDLRTDPGWVDAFRDWQDNAALPLEWWEHVQLDLIEAFTREHQPDMLARVQRMRLDPAEWRAFRERLGRKGGKVPVRTHNRKDPP